MAVRFTIDQSPPTIPEERHLQVTERHGRNKLPSSQQSGANPARLPRQSLEDGQLPDIPLPLRRHTTLDAREAARAYMQCYWELARHKADWRRTCAGIQGFRPNLSQSFHRVLRCSA